MSEDQFQQWINGRSNLPLGVKGHTFVLRGGNIVVVDGGKFVYEDAVRLVRLLNSNNPFDQISANLMIVERNGALRFIALALAAIILIVAIVLAVR
jgi:hypothetical protein